MSVAAHSLNVYERGCVHHGLSFLGVVCVVVSFMFISMFCGRGMNMYTAPNTTISAIFIITAVVEYAPGIRSENFFAPIFNVHIPYINAIENVNRVVLNPT